MKMLGGDELKQEDLNETLLSHLQSGAQKDALRLRVFCGPYVRILSLTKSALNHLHISFRQARIKVPFHRVELYVDHIHDGFVRAFTFRLGDEHFVSFIA